MCKSNCSMVYRYSLECIRLRYIVKTQSCLCEFYSIYYNILEFIKLKKFDTLSISKVESRNFKNYARQYFIFVYEKYTSCHSKLPSFKNGRVGISDHYWSWNGDKMKWKEKRLMEGKERKEVSQNKILSEQVSPRVSVLYHFYYSNIEAFLC